MLILVVALMALVVLDLLAVRYGVDSRDYSYKPSI